ncbi:D-alanine--D-alanine ligase [Azotosporobacter soli]|uniref:D-alanine--D-alanine ligase n=1 Tax=Azotosporobacter soli TaxID=3055040 RepID=UPI0031FE6F8F
MKDKKIAVVMGGPSTEREVSLRTGGAILTALQEKGYNAVGIDLEPANLLDQLRKEQIDVVFNAVHGLYGEDGVLQGALELAGIPYTGSRVMASAMAMDKGISKRLFEAAQIPTPRSRLFQRSEDQAVVTSRIAAEFSLPVVVKATSQGSSIGVVIVKEAKDVPAAVAEAFRYSEELLVEEFIVGRELTVAVLAGAKFEVFPVIEIVPHSGQYDYHSKYTKGASDYRVPAQLEAVVEAKVKQVAADAFKVLHCSGIARVDVMLDQQGNPYVLEVNTIPGMTETSLVPKAAAAVGLSFGDLCERLLLACQ